AIGRGGVHVVRDGKPEVSGKSSVTDAALQHVLARPEELHHRERQIDEMVGIGGTPAIEKCRERSVVRLIGQRLADIGGERASAAGSGPLPSSHAPTASYVSFA